MDEVVLIRQASKVIFCFLYFIFYYKFVKYQRPNYSTNILIGQSFLQNSVAEHFIKCIVSPHTPKSHIF